MTRWRGGRRRDLGAVKDVVGAVETEDEIPRWWWRLELRGQG